MTTTKNVTPSKLTRSFLASRGDWNHTTNDIKWLGSVFGCILRVARANREFTVDEIWEQINGLRGKGKLPNSRIDHRILGPMIRHMVTEGYLGSTGYYTKSMRPHGGSRPVTIWQSFIAAPKARV